MSPLYEYTCPNDHTTTELVPFDQSLTPIDCPTCGKPAERDFPIPHMPPDGIYSYCPNIGTPEQFERRKADADARADRTGTYKP